MVSGICCLNHPNPSRTKTFLKRLVIGYFLFGSTIAFSFLFAANIAPLLKDCNPGSDSVLCLGELHNALDFLAKWNFVLSNFVFGLVFLGVDIWLRAASIRAKAT